MAATPRENVATPRSDTMVWASPRASSKDISGALLEEGGGEKNESKLAKTVLAIVLFSLSSGSMIIANKASVGAFKHPFVLLVIQNTVSVPLILLVQRILPKKPPPEDPSAPLPPKKSELAVRWLPCAVLFCSNLGTSMLALQYVSVATFAVLRNLNPFASSFFSRLLLGNRTSRFEYYSIAVCLVGSTIYGLTDIQFSFVGYCLCLVHICSMALYSVVVKSRSKFLDSTTMSLLNNIESLPVFICCAAVNGEASSGNLTHVIDELREPRTATWVGLSCVGGSAISVTAFNLQKLIAPTSFLVLNNLNKIPSILVSAVLFANPISLQMGVGLAISLIGGYTFSMAASEKGKDAAPSKTVKNTPTLLGASLFVLLLLSHGLVNSHVHMMSQEDELAPKSPPWLLERMRHKGH